MLFQSLTKQKLQSLAGNTIYERGLNYFKNGAVTKIWLEDNKLLAKVSGNYGDYQVKIEEQDDKYDWKCSCPYDGHICKHLVAVGLEFLDKKDEMVSQGENAAKQNIDLRDKLLLLDKKELVDLLMLSLKTHTNWKNIFLKKTVEKLDRAGFKEKNQQIYEEEFYSHFTRACEILEEFNQYGGGDPAEENEVYDELEDIKKLFQEKKLNEKLKQEFFEKMFYYYDWDNSGLSDYVIDAIYEIASGDDDWRYIIKKLQANKKDNDWRQNMIADIYKDHLKDEDKYLKLRGKNLKWGRDYYDLVDFWDKKGEKEKAVEIAKQGIQKCENGLLELFEYLFRYYKKQDYNKALDYLKKIYTDQHCLENYKRLKEFVKTEDWLQLDVWCRDLLSKDRQSYQLAKIYEHNKEYDKVLDYVLQNRNDDWGDWGFSEKEEFANKLINKYPQELLPFYKKRVDRHINTMSRKSYQRAAEYAKKVQKIYCQYLNVEDEWHEYIKNLREKHTKKPALIDEFKGL